MGMYDKEVSEKLGEDAVKEILDDARSGFISRQQMEDVAKPVLGRSLSRGHFLILKPMNPLFTAH